MADDHQKNLQRFMAKQKQKKSISSSSSATPVTPPPPPPPPHTASASASFLHGRDHQVVLVQNGDGANNNINVRIENNAVGNNNNYRVVRVFPPGYRFCPLDSELIIHYLMKKIKNEALPHDQIKDVNLYHFNPNHLSARYEPVSDREWYFFTPRDRKYRNGNRPNRAAGDGYWKATGADKAIRYNGKKVGFRKALVFYEGKPPVGAKTNWIMHEYRANGPERTRLNAHDMRLDDWVLCRLYHKEEKDSKSQARSVKDESAQRPRARVRSHDHQELFNTTQMMNNNEASSSEMGSMYNGEENLSDYHHHRLMMKKAYGEMHPTGFPHAFPPQAPPPPPPPPLPPPPHPPFIDFANSSNGGFQQPLMYGSRPVNVSRPPYLSGGNVSRSHYHEEDQLWNLYRRGLIQEPMWDNHNNLQNFPGSSQFDISSINFMVEPPNWNYLDIDFGVINPSDDVNNYNNHPADVHLPYNAVNDKPSSDETLDDIVIDYPPEDPPVSPSKPEE